MVYVKFHLSEKCVTNESKSRRIFFGAFQVSLTVLLSRVIILGIKLIFLLNWLVFLFDIDALVSLLADTFLTRSAQIFDEG